MNIAGSADMKKDKMDYDVIIIGSGISGSLLGAILGKNKLRVLLIENGSHPKFAIGESTIPETAMMLKIMSEQFQIPEIDYINGINNISKHVTSSCGQKRHFGFLYYGPDGEQRKEETNQTRVYESDHGPEAHLFRQDIDAYLCQVAIMYGVKYVDHTVIKDLSIQEDFASLTLPGGKSVKASYIVDAGGFRSPLADKYGLRDSKCRFKTESRSIFSHFVNVGRYEDQFPLNYHGMRSWSEGTLHHVFSEGWIWVIPFNNHEQAKNGLCSVGVKYDMRKMGQKSPNAEAEFSALYKRLPGFAKQMESAKLARGLVSTDRIQYSSSSTIGHRFCLLGHAAGFIDALYSRGLLLTVLGVHELASTLLECAAAGDYSLQKFQNFNRLQQATLDFNDRLVATSYSSFGNYGLWNAVWRLWVGGTFLGFLSLRSALKNYYLTGNKSELRNCVQSVKYPGCPAPSVDEYQSLFTKAEQEIVDYFDGRTKPEVAEQRIYSLLKESDIFPGPWAFWNPKNRTYPSVPRNEIYDWGIHSKNPQVRVLFSSPGIYKEWAGGGVKIPQSKAA